MVKKAALSNIRKKESKKSQDKKIQTPEDEMENLSEKEVIDTPVIDSNVIKRKVEIILQKVASSVRRKLNSVKLTNSYHKNKKNKCENFNSLRRRENKKTAIKKFKIFKIKNS